MSLTRRAPTQSHPIWQRVIFITSVIIVPDHQGLFDDESNRPETQSSKTTVVWRRRSTVSCVTSGRE